MDGVFESWGDFQCRLQGTGHVMAGPLAAEWRFGLIRCLVPPQSDPLHRTVTVEVSFDGGALWTDSGLQFEYLPTPSITALVPDTVYPARNGTVSVLGANFESLPLYSQNWLMLHYGSEGDGPLTPSTSGSSRMVLPLHYVNATVLEVHIPPLFPAEHGMA